MREYVYIPLQCYIHYSASLVVGSHFTKTLRHQQIGYGRGEKANRDIRLRSLNV